VSIMDDFIISGGSVRGTDHIRKGINNHDAIHMSYDAASDSVIGVVCDGCGSGQDSEVGAKTAALLVSTSIARNLIYTPIAKIWPGVRQEVCSHIHTFALAMENGDAVRQVIATKFLFTIVGFVINPQETVMFWIGDGYHSVAGVVGEDGEQNIKTYVHEPAAGNCPPYIAYNLVNTSVDFGERGLEFSSVTMPTEEVQGVMAATDGIMQMDLESEKAVRPNNPNGEKVGPISQFLCQPPYLSNKFAVQRKLARMNPYSPLIITDKETQRVNLHLGHMNDDTSVVVARRKES
jgi:hypothetical protein